MNINIESALVFIADPFLEVKHFLIIGELARIVSSYTIDVQEFETHIMKQSFDTYAKLSGEKYAYFLVKTEESVESHCLSNKHLKEWKEQAIASYKRLFRIDFGQITFFNLLRPDVQSSNCQRSLCYGTNCTCRNPLIYRLATN